MQAIETNTKMGAIQIQVRAETGAKSLMNGVFPQDLTREEQVLAQRLVELWKQKEKASVYVDYRMVVTEKVDKAVYVIGILRQGGTKEPYGQTAPDPSKENEMRDELKETVNHPPHYATHPSGVEAVDIAEHLSFNLGNAFKYVWRAKKKGKQEEDLEKAIWYLEREVRFFKLTGENMELFYPARLNARKTFDKEGNTTALGKFLETLLAYPHDVRKQAPGTPEDPGVRMLGRLMEIVRTELRLVKKGESR